MEGTTENKTLVTRLLADLQDRGLDVSGGVLFVVDGSKALTRGIPTVNTSGYGSSCAGGGQTPTRPPPTPSSKRWSGHYSVNIPALLPRCGKDFQRPSR
jgi:hypothetical protein